MLRLCVGGNVERPGAGPPRETRKACRRGNTPYADSIWILPSVSEPHRSRRHEAPRPRRRCPACGPRGFRVAVVLLKVLGREEQAFRPDRSLMPGHGWLAGGRLSGKGLALRTSEAREFGRRTRTEGLRRPDTSDIFRVEAHGERCRLVRRHVGDGAPAQPFEIEITRHHADELRARLDRLVDALVIAGTQCVFDLRAVFLVVERGLVVAPRASRNRHDRRPRATSVHRSARRSARAGRTRSDSRPRALRRSV